MAGVIAPAGFLAISFTMAVLRSEIIDAQGWAGWPSSMATGGPPAAVPQIVAFLWLAGWYTVFSLGAVRPALHDPLTTGAFLAVAAGDILLAFPTDAAGQPLSWHGGVHVLGVLVATFATVVAAAGSLRATQGRPGWRPWRLASLVLFAAAILLVGGLDHGWAKVAYVVGITAPVAVFAWCIRGELERAT
jgi:hypothetical protein